MLGKLNCNVTKVIIFLITLVLIAGVAGCNYIPPSQNLEIRTWYDLDAIRYNLAGNHTLMNDLNSTTPGYTKLAGPAANGGKGWQPIGAWGDRFTGSLNGQGYEIRDLFIARPDDDWVGLFSVVDGTGVVRNVGVVNAEVSGGDHEVGALIGRNRGTVLNCYSTGSVSGGQWVGGLVGMNDGWGDIVPAATLIYASYSPPATIEDSYSAAFVSGNQAGIGGLVGDNSAGTLSRSYSTGNVTGRTWVGGLVGSNSEATVSDCYSTGSVSGNASVGGLVGANVWDAAVSNSYSIGSVTGNSSVGGLTGWNSNNASVSNSYSAGDVTGDVNVGGLVGLNEGTATVSNSFWDTQASGQDTSDGGTGQNTTEMQYIATFSGAAWNIIAVALNETNPAYIWNIVNNVTYPFLSWQP